MRKAFTLIELLVIIAIVGVMTTVSVLGVRAGQGAVRVKAASRDIMAYIRHARSVALVTMQPAVVVYSTERVDDEVCARVVVNSAKLMDSRKITSAETISGETIELGDPEAGEGGGGETIEEVLFSPISDDIVKGVRIKVLVGDEMLVMEEEEKRRNRISVFSTADYWLGKFEQREKTMEASAENDEEESRSEPEEEDEPVKLVWEVNGRCEPHRVYVYADGDKPENGLVIKVDRFGAMRVIESGEED